MIEQHTHNGIDAQRVESKELSPYQVFKVIPTHKGQQGEIILVDDLSSIRRLYIYLNGTWRYTNLT